MSRKTGRGAPEFRGDLIRVRVLKSEGGAFAGFVPGHVIDAPAELAKPRIKDGRWRLAPDEKLTSFAIE